MKNALALYSVHGGSLAVAKDGRLVFARGYGLADVEANKAVEPTSLFRYCSISKSFVAAAIMRLVEDGRTGLDDVIWDHAPRLRTYNGAWGDPAMRRITIRQVLTHSAGWDRDRSGDPILPAWCIRASQATHKPYPPTDEVLAQYVLSQPLDFAPGSRFAYSNFGFMLLSLLVEDVTGRRYYEYVREQILEPVGTGGIRQGATAIEDRLPGEVRYYDYAGAPWVPSAYTLDQSKTAPAPYGLAILRAGAGGMVGSAVDLAKFNLTLDGQRPWFQLKPGSFDAMIAKVPRQIWALSNGWFGFGIEVHEADPLGLHWGHGGAFPGSRTLYFRLENGATFVFLFNGDSRSGEIGTYAIGAIASYLSTLTDWPEHDLFPSYYAPRPGDSGPSARGGIYSLYGMDLAGPEMKVVLRDSSGAERELKILYASAGQVNCVLPDEAVEGAGTIVVRRAVQPEGSAPIEVRAVAPMLYAGSTVRDNSGARFLTLYGTGIRNRSSLTEVRVHFRGLDLPSLYAGPQYEYAGLDQVNVDLASIPPGAADVQVVADGSASPRLRILIE